MQANTDESTILIVKVKAFFFFAQVNKQNTVLEYIRVQFYENKISALSLAVYLALRTGPWWI